MVRKRRSYSWELKIEAVALVTEGGLSISHAARCSPNPSSRPLRKPRRKRPPRARSRPNMWETWALREGVQTSV
jgi:transposase-like protein